MYYNSNDLFSRQSPMNFIMGERGNGKSFEAKSRMIKNFLKKGEQAVYIRRRQTDIDNVKDNFFDDIMEFFPDVEFKVNGDRGYINGETAIHFIPLSTSYKVKSKPFPRVTLLVFDEYIEPMTKFPNYFKDDMFKLFELINTIVRKRNNWKILLIGNAISYVNPFFTYFDIKIKDPKRRFHSFKFDEDFQRHMVTVELTETPEFREEYKKSIMAKIIGGTSYGDYAMSAETYEDNEEYILPERKGIHVFICSIYSNGQEVGIWFNEDADIYCDNVIEKDSKNKFYVYDNDMQNGYVNIKAIRGGWRAKQIVAMYREGRMFFKDQECKKFMQENIKYIG